MPASNTHARKYGQTSLPRLQGETDKPRVIDGDVNISPPVIDRSSRQKVSKDRDDLIAPPAKPASAVCAYAILQEQSTHFSTLEPNIYQGERSLGGYLGFKRLELKQSIYSAQDSN